MSSLHQALTSPLNNGISSLKVLHTQLKRMNLLAQCKSRAKKTTFWFVALVLAIWLCSANQDSINFRLNRGRTHSLSFRSSAWTNWRTNTSPLGAVTVTWTFIHLFPNRIESRNCSILMAIPMNLPTCSRLPRKKRHLLPSLPAVRVRKAKKRRKSSRRSHPPKI